MATDGKLPNGYRNTARAYADAICAFPDEQFKRSDLQPALRSALDDLKETPVIAVVDQVRTGEVFENIYDVTREALDEAESTVANRDAVCPCGHSGLRNQGEYYECGFRACEEEFDRDELGGPIAQPDGGSILRRFAGECDCGRRVTITLPRTGQEIAADGTARVRCANCETIVRVTADPPADERAVRADGGTEQCPVCDESLDPNMGAPYTWWCSECEMEYWREDGWYRCGADGEREPVAVTDGGREITAYEVADDRPAISYGPDPYRDGEWCLSATTGAERVELLLGDRAMYQLWTEVRGVPGPTRPGDDTDRLVRQLVHLANGADEAMLKDALAVLGDPDHRERRADQ